MNALTAQEKAVGRSNFQAAVGSDFTRRDFLLGGLAAGVVSGAGLGAFYFGYGKMKNALPIGIIGTGDEGGVLIGALTPSYVDVVAISDIRPYNVHRAFHGDQSTPSAMMARPGLMAKYGWKSEDEAKKHVKVHTDYKDLLKDPAIKGVIIALPLHLHHSVAIEAMQAGKHVLTEKLMGQTVGKCKSMGRVAHRTNKHLATGHQRHYSILYDNAVDVIKRGLIGDLHHIRAQWHRGNLPGKDSWQPRIPDAKMQADLLKAESELAAATGTAIEAAQKKVNQLKLWMMDFEVDAKKYGYQSKKTADGKGELYDPLKELIQWRLWARTGGGLMAELGSHQLDASGIFCSALRKDGKKARPLTVVAVGGRHIFPEDREVDDHVYCNYEFPGPDYKAEDPVLKNKKVVVTYSSINGNGWGGYGEIVMGTKGTIVLETEQEYQLYSTGGPATFVDVTKGKDGALALDTTASAPPAAAVGEKALGAGPVSRGYTEEIEHWAYCIENNPDAKDPAVQPKCKPEVAMADAIIALTTNIAIRDNKRIEFKDEWFDINHDDTPEGEKPEEKV
jgi:predicted dehydrogenase